MASFVPQLISNRCRRARRGMGQPGMESEGLTALIWELEGLNVMPEITGDLLRGHLENLILSTWSE